MPPCGHNFHYKWWNTIHGELPVQRSSPCFDSTSSYVLAYVKLSSHEMSSIGVQMMNYIGGQSHYHCKIHKLPVIISTTRHGTCSNANCSKKEHYVCPTKFCKTIVCKPCVDSAPDNVITFSNDGLTETDVDIDTLEEPHADMDLSNYDGTDNDNDDEFMELMNDYLTTDGTIGVDSDFLLRMGTKIFQMMIVLVLKFPPLMLVTSHSKSKKILLTGGSLVILPFLAMFY